MVLRSNFLTAVFHKFCLVHSWILGLKYSCSIPSNKTSLLRLNWSYLKMFRSSRPEVFHKKCVLGNFAKFIEKQLCQNLIFNKVAVKVATFIKKRLWHRRFPVNFAKFLRTPFLWNISGGCAWMLWLRARKSMSQPFPANSSSLCTLKTSENLCFCIFSGSIEESRWAVMGNSTFLEEILNLKYEI